MAKEKPTRAYGLVISILPQFLEHFIGTDQERINPSSSQTHFVMSSTSLECPACKAKSNGVAPSSLGKDKA